MANKTLNTRIQNKIDTAANWSQATNFSPLKGELAIYQDNGISQIKIGDGTTNVNNLPFVVDTLDVLELPTSNISDSLAYRLLQGQFVYKTFLRNDSTCYIVSWDTTPSTPGEDVFTESSEGISLVGYYNIKDNKVYGYFTDNVKTLLKARVDASDQSDFLKKIAKGIIDRLSTGWNTLNSIFKNTEVYTGISYGDVIISRTQATEENKVYLYLTYNTFIYRNNNWITLEKEILKGSGLGAEIFNSTVNTASGPGSHAEGYNTKATAAQAHAEGNTTTASGYASHAEGDGTVASGSESHAEGGATVASAYCAHAEGHTTKASANYSHTEGQETEALKTWSHAEGYKTVADAYAGHAEGYGTKVTTNYGHVQGMWNEIDDISQYAHIVGWGSSDTDRKNIHTIKKETGDAWFAGDVKAGDVSLIEVSNQATGVGKIVGDHSEIFNDYSTNVIAETSKFSHAEGSGNTINSNRGHAEGSGNSVLGYAAHAEGGGNQANTQYCHVEGNLNRAQGEASHAEGKETVAQGNMTHTEGNKTFAFLPNSHAEGNSSILATNVLTLEDHLMVKSQFATKITPIWEENKFSAAIGEASHVEGKDNLSIGDYSHTEGYGNYTETSYSHAEGYNTKSKGRASHSEGIGTIASGEAAHAEGASCQATGSESHAEGSTTIASAYCAHAEGCNTQATASYQHVQGKFNNPDSSMIHIVGWGSDDAHRENYHTIDNKGNAYYKGDVKAGDVSLQNTNTMANDAISMAGDAMSMANDAKNMASEAENRSHEAENIASDALLVANDALNTINGFDGKSIIDVEDINSVLNSKDDVIYRMPLNYLLIDGKFYDYATVYRNILINAEKPDSGIEFRQDFTNSRGEVVDWYTVYYSHYDNDYYAYLQDMGGWMTLAELVERYSYFGINYSYEGECVDASSLSDDSIAILKTSALYTISHGKANKLVINRSSNYFAESFNSIDNKATGSFSHAEGVRTRAEGYASHAEGDGSKAIGPESHAEGGATQALGWCSHAEGYSTIAAGTRQHVQGRYNIIDNEHKYAHIVGNGLDEDVLDENGNIIEQNRSNAHTLDWQGNAWFAKSVSIGGAKIEFDVIHNRLVISFN